jgi:coenzyme F420-0:L-glutamate ligase/coenzyme F420-1:gamma-L-glutamate ligase
VRGRGDLVLPPDDDGPGASGLLRPEGADLFGYGAREAVLAALRRSSEDLAPFGEPVDADELAGVLAVLTGAEISVGAGELSLGSADQHVRWVVEVAAYAHGWEVADAEPSLLVLRPHGDSSGQLRSGRRGPRPGDGRPRP